MTSPFPPIAIVGRSCILPGAHSPDALWDAVAAGRDLVSSAPEGRWRLPKDLALTPDPARSADRAWSDRGGYVTGFDAAFVEELGRDPFPRGSDDLLALDPLFHWVLSAGRTALREAGHDRPSERVGAVIGNLSFPSSAMSGYAEQVWFGARARIDPRNRFMSGLPALMLAEQLGLGGGAFALDAACASSLYAMKLACDRLNRGEIDLALAGAVCRSDDLFIHVGFCALDAMSKTGQSRPFHRDADGLVPAEGAAFVVLKRLSDVADGERVFGVIRAIGLSNDGRGRGLLAPSVEGQARALRAAWDSSGVDPRRLGLVECHATGTPVGDAAEIRTLTEVFGGHVRDVPIGSVKSNLGHPITAAGATGLLKVLGAVRNQIRPPTLHVEQPTGALRDSPFRLLAEAEPWPSHGPRVGCVSAFGFGGNNAHLIVEEYVPGSPIPAPPSPRAPVGVAVVGMGVRAADGRSTAEFVGHLVDGTSRVRAARGTAAPVTLPLERLKFPPRDLQQSLGQQLLVLDATFEAVGDRTLPRERTAVIIGAQSDPEVCRYGARWRLRGWERDADPKWLAAACDAVVPVLESAGVVGNMPNIPANRLGSQFDWGGPGFTVSSEELSGLTALRIGAQLLQSGEVDAAVVGAVDLSAEAVHEAAIAALLPQRPSGDAAVVLVLERLEDARAAGHPILAVLSEADPDDPVLGSDGLDLGARFGVAHAAHAMVHLAAAIAGVAHGLRPTDGPAEPWAGPRGLTVRARSLTGTTDAVGVSSDDDDARPLPSAPPAPGRVLTLAAHPPPVVLPPRPGEKSEMHGMSPAPRLPVVTFDLRLPALPVPAVSEMAKPPGVQPAARPAPAAAPAPPKPAPAPPKPAPAQQPLTPTLSPQAGRGGSSRSDAPAAAIASHGPRLPPPLPAPAPAPEAQLVSNTSPPLGPNPAVLAGIADLTRKLSEAHQEYLVRQQQVHGQFLALRQRASATLLEAAAARGATAPPEVAVRSPQGPTPAAFPALPAPAPVARVEAPRPASPKPAAPQPATPAPKPVAPAPQPAAAKPVAPAPKPAGPPKPVVARAAEPPKTSSRTRVPAAELPGPKFDRAQLESLASDKISAVLGPMFAVQDAFPRQVRMPEPPLLLADRVVGIDAEPGSMTTGVIWTETDVTPDAWYLHDGTMPAGVMIEAGQADLLLISWLGADFKNRGERVYRLLGCVLTYHGGLPRPGTTLRYEIHVDGHANLGKTGIFFFHSDCTDDDGTNRLAVREGQAGFFSEAELAESGGILWTPETGEHDRSARLDPPAVREIRRSYDHAQVLAFANGDAYACFGRGHEGRGYERLQTHVRTPRIAAPPMSFWQRVTDLDPKGGPWKRGYLRAEQDVTAEDWFFQGHFKDDPCMPGTMMFEACLQALGFYLTALGYTVRKDGWTFEVVPDLAYELKCRGQVTPTSRDLVYEVFVEEVHDGPWPTAYADFLCTIDGLKAFHARRVGLRLRPDWPITSRPELQNLGDPKPVAQTPDGFRFGYDSLLACAWGKPSDAFGPMYRPFDNGKQCARLPGPPYHFMSRVTKLDGPIGGMKTGTAIELEYAFAEDEWYFSENSNRTMPFCVLLEAALQPCGWIASYVGSALTTEKELLFRNLDGTATWSAEVFPDSVVLTTSAKINAISTAGGMIIEGFEVTCRLGEQVVYVMKTVFGFFPPESFAAQVGITYTAEERAQRDAPSEFLVDLDARPERYCGGSLALAGSKLLMLDRVTGFWPTGGAKGLGRLRSEKDVDPSEWFFKAHFFADPVQPGSLGIEAMVQLLQFFMIHTGMHEGMESPRFEPLMMGRPLTWKYRGQVVPENKRIFCEVEITEIGEDERGRFAVCDAYLWVDELRIYQGIGLGMRIVDDPTRRPRPPLLPTDGEVILDPAREPWLRDHPPTWTLPALPAMSMVDRLAGAVAPRKVVEVRDVQVHKWVVLPGPVRTRTVTGATTGDRTDVVLEVWRDAPDPRLSRFEPAASGTVITASAWPPAPTPIPPRDAPEIPDPYASGHLFHGPAFRYLKQLWRSDDGGAAILDARAGSVPPGTLHQGLLDAVTHAIPHDALYRWSDRVSPTLAAYPHTIERLRLFGPAPAGEVRVEARFAGFVDERRPRIHVQAIDLSRGAVWLEMDLVEILLPKGPIGEAPASDRLAFLRDRRFVPGLGLSEVDGDTTTATRAAIAATDWLPGTVAAVYRSTGDLVEDVAVGDHVAARALVHPGTVSHDGSAAEAEALSSAQPLTRWPIAIDRSDDRVTVRSTGEPTLNIDPVEHFWDRWFGIGRWPVEDLYYGLIRRFVRRVHVVDPEALAAVRGRSTLYLGNHQVGVESLLFSVLASGLTGVSTVTLAKAEHRETWLGKLIAHCFAYPGVADPNVITFFDREDKNSLGTILQDLSTRMAGPGKSVMVHVEGTRSLECRTPVQKMSGAFVDMAIAIGSPIVPIRFVGALPVEPVPERLEFPVGMGSQDLWLGAPIAPETLEALPYKERKDLVIGAINGLGVANADERPFPGDPALQQRVEARVGRTAVDLPHAVLMEVLSELGSPHEDTARLVAGDRAGELVVGDSPAERWLAELARRLYGPFGARVRVR